MTGTLVKLLTLAGALTVPAAGQAVPPVSDDVGVKAHAFDISQVVLHDSRLEENQVSLLHSQTGSPIAPRRFLKTTSSRAKALGPY
jgi:hypothetical protein